VPLCPAEVDGSDGRVVEWRRFAMEEVISKKGKVMKKLNLVYKKTSSAVFLEFLKPKLQAFVTYNFVTRWEDKQFKKSMKSFLKTPWFQLWISLRTTNLKVKMRSNLYIGFLIRLVFLSR